MITRQVVSATLLKYLQAETTLAELVDWAETSIGLTDFGPDEDIDMLMDVMLYLRQQDTAYFPLRWDIISRFMQQLGTPIKVVSA
ncbi:MAG: hypothetical protein H7Y11_10510 [Armatimonadetes bacterium]|nr:hypothetical protein [Anaerolineae bacterium]